MPAGEQVIPISRQPQPLGGERVLFHCPDGGQHCRRVLWELDGKLRCRQCAGIAYTSTHRNDGVFVPAQRRLAETIAKMAKPSRLTKKQKASFIREAKHKRDQALLIVIKKAMGIE